MFFKMKQLLPFLVVFAALSSCNEYQKVLKNEDTKAKYDLAQKFYDAKDFKRANRLFEQIAPKYAGKPQGERVMFFLADTYFQREDYNMAGYQFERFLKQYPKSDKVPEAAFMGAKSYYELSPNYSLDQADTDKALMKLQSFINTYGESEYFEEANAMAKELTTKKEQKAIEIAKQYSKLGIFYDLQYSKSALAAFDNFISDYPGSVFREEALYYRVEASTNLAFNSFKFLQKDRLESAKAAHAVLFKNFPETQFADKANKLLKKIDKELENFVELEELSSAK